MKLATQTIIPESHEHWLSLREKVLTSTQIAALFNLSKYSTEFELFHEKTGQTKFPFTANERMRWGNRLEESIARGAAEEFGWQIRPMKEFIFNEDLRLGSSFDFCIVYPAEESDACTYDEAILEIKNVDSLIYHNEWSEDQAPAHIELQLQFQMLLSGIGYGKICALVGGNELKVIEREADPQIHAAILNKAAEFWAKVDANECPDPDFEKDANYITELYRQSNDDTFDAEHNEKLHDLATSYDQASKDFKEAAARKKALQAEIFHIVGAAKKVQGVDYTISCATTKDSLIKEHVRKGYRGFRLTWKKKGK